MQTLPIFASVALRAFEDSHAGRGTGDVFLPFLKESAARQDEDLPRYRETARPDEPPRDFDARIDERRTAPRRGEDSRPSTADRRDERRDVDDVGRDRAAAPAEDEVQRRIPAERDAPPADNDTHAAARPEDNGGTEPNDTAARQETREVEPDGAPRGAAEATAFPAMDDRAALARPAAGGALPGPQVLAQAVPSTETAADGAGEAAPDPGAPQGPAANDQATAQTGQAAPAVVAAPVAPGAALAETTTILDRTGPGAAPQAASGTDPLLVAAMGSADSRRLNTGAQAVPNADPGDPGAGKAAAPGLEGRVTPARPAGADQAPAQNSTLAAATVLAQANQKTGATGSAAAKAQFALGAAAGGMGSPVQAEGQPLAQSAMTTGQAGQTAARAFGAPPAAANRPSGPAVPVGEVAVHIHRAAVKGEERVRIQLHPAELGQIDVRLKLGADGITRALVQVERPETLDLLQRDARGLERALQDAGLKTDSNSLSFSLRDHGQGGLYERYGQTGGFDGGAEHAGAPEAPEGLEAQVRPMSSNRALDIHV